MNMSVAAAVVPTLGAVSLVQLFLGTLHLNSNSGEASCMYLVNIFSSNTLFELDHLVVSWKVLDPKDSDVAQLVVILVGSSKLTPGAECTNLAHLDVRARLDSMRALTSSCAPTARALGVHRWGWLLPEGRKDHLLLCRLQLAA
jgi:hypothetical protein